MKIARFACFYLSLMLVSFTLIILILMNVCIIYLHLGDYRVNCYSLMCFACWDLQKIIKRKNSTKTRFVAFSYFGTN